MSNRSDLRIVCLAALSALAACGGPSVDSPAGNQAGAEPSAKPAETVASPAASDVAKTKLTLEGVTLTREALLGTPDGRGMVTLSVAEAPKGAIFLMATFSSSCLPAGVEPSLVGTDGGSRPLKQLTPLQDDCKDPSGRYIAIFQVKDKEKSFVLANGPDRVSVDITAVSKKPSGDK